jgi:hypothetical protein
LPTEKEAYQELIASLFRLPFVRYAVVTDDFGHRYAGGMKPGVESSTPSALEKRLEAQAVLILKMADGYVPYVGKLVWTTIRWENVIAMFFLLGEDRGTLAVTIQGNTEMDSMQEIRKQVDDWIVAHP